MQVHGPKHNGKLRLHRRGLIVPVDDAHLGVSIDRLATCDCGQDFCKKEWIVEIKCPLSISTMQAWSHQAASRLSYLKCSQPTSRGNFTIELRESSAYYTQLQMQMAITGIHESELWIWVTNESEDSRAWWFDPIEVAFNAPLWEQLKATFDVFYREYVAPMILTFAREFPDID